MNAIAALGGRGVDVSDAKLVGQKKPSLVARILVGVAVFALLMLGYTSWRDSLIADGYAQGKAAAEQAAKAELGRQQTEITGLKRQVSSLSNGLRDMTNERDRLGVQLTTLKVAKRQLGEDFKEVVAANAKGAPPKKASPPEKKRRG